MTAVCLCCSTSWLRHCERLAASRRVLTTIEVCCALSGLADNYQHCMTATNMSVSALTAIVLSYWMLLLQLDGWGLRLLRPWPVLFPVSLPPPPSDPPSNAPWFFNRLRRYISSVLTYLLTYLHNSVAVPHDVTINLCGPLIVITIKFLLRRLR